MKLKGSPIVPFWYNKGVMEMAKGAYDSAMDDFIKSHNLAKGSRMSYHDDLVLRMIQCDPTKAIQGSH